MREAPVGHLADPELTAYIESERHASGPTPRQVGAVEARRLQRLRAATRPAGPALAEVTEVTVDGPVPVSTRLYRPTLEPTPLVVFLHGGMWTIGDLESHDGLCRRLAVAARAAVLAVDYRRAPEHPWPAAIDDGVAVFRWAAEHAVELSGTTHPPAIAGDSSGGNLAALICLRLRDQGGPLPAVQILACPNTDLTLSRPSTRTKATGWGLTTDAVAWGIENWVPDPRRRADPAVSPLFAVASAGLPPAVIVTAEHDPLRDEGDEYAARLRAAGVPVRHRCEPGMVHGFLTLAAIAPSAAAAGERLFADVAELLPR
ncbi:alpha/beta hydrolase [Embleya sp. NBC_00896]|uniref:alpha/beta hydrolase n=1 Tax=Embleya sp. NBC_00896 TaxID=2975961 RepID=UPI002F907D51|nr:alpha/beta hydrolase [Embleya sp. NBC_00896]